MGGGHQPGSSAHQLFGKSSASAGPVNIEGMATAPMCRGLVTNCVKRSAVEGSPAKPCGELGVQKERLDGAHSQSSTCVQTVDGAIGSGQPESGSCAMLSNVHPG